MFYRLYKTPLHAAFFCSRVFFSVVFFSVVLGSGLLAGCKPGQTGPQAVHAQCPGQTTAIARVQGDRAESPLLGQRLSVQGIVTLVQGNRGFYIEEPGSDADERTSNALFIQSSHLPEGIGPGSLISVEGVVAELGEGRHPVTALTDTGEPVQCASGQPLPLTDVTLPLDGRARESIENMRIRIDDTLVATDVYRFGQGSFTLSGNGLQFVPTEIMAPGPQAGGQLAVNSGFALPVFLPEHLGTSELLISGTAFEHITGVLAHDGRDMRLTLQSIPAFSGADFTPPAAARAGSLRVVGMNLHNYFNGDGRGRGFPTQRGAETAEEFRLQRARIGAAIEVLNPHIVAVMELENDGFGKDSAAQDFIRLANDVTGKSWSVTRPHADNTGTDMITVGIFYRGDTLEAVGPAHTLSGPEFEHSRQPQAQLFRQLPGGDTMLVVINHLKSKGSCPDSGDDADNKDGQGCWNPMRLAAAQKMSAWANEVAASAGTDHILVLGDMNAYRNEDPIAAIRRAGFTELMDAQQGRVYSFVFYGQHGTLDYAFSSDGLREKIEDAFIWHVNVALPQNMKLPQPWLGFSDHDPVVVDIRMRQSSTSD